MKKTILIVDDEPTILKLLEFVLAKDYNIILKNNGYEAIHWLEGGNKPDLIILDVNMPYFNGPEFLKSIKISGLFSNIPVIVLTGTSDTNKIRRELSFPVNEIIHKPFNPTKLKDAVKYLLSEDTKFTTSEN
ncbi:response regulator [Niabella aquatica]